MKKFFVLYSLKQKLTPTLYKTKLTVTKHASTNQSLKFEEFESEDQAKRFIQKLVNVTTGLSQKQERRTPLTEKQVKEIFQSILQDTKANTSKDNQKSLVKDKDKTHQLAISQKFHNSLSLNAKTNNWALQSINHGLLIKTQSQTKDSSYSISGKEAQSARASEQASTEAQTNYTQTHTTEESSFKEKKGNKKFAHWVLWNKNDLTRTIKLGRKKEELLKILNELEKQHSAEWVKENITIEDYRLKKQASTAYDNLIQKRKKLLDHKRAQLFSQVVQNPQFQKSVQTHQRQSEHEKRLESNQLSQSVNQNSIKPAEKQIQQPQKQERISSSLDQSTQPPTSSQVLTSEQKTLKDPSESFVEDQEQEQIPSLKWQDETNELESTEIKRRKRKVEEEQSKIVIDWDQVKEINYLQSIASENREKQSPKTKLSSKKQPKFEEDIDLNLTFRYQNTFIAYEQIFTTPINNGQSQQKIQQKIENESLKQHLASLTKETKPEIENKVQESSGEDFICQIKQKPQITLSQTAQLQMSVKQTKKQLKEQVFWQEELPKEQLLIDQPNKNQLTSQTLQKQKVSQSFPNQTLKQEKIVQQQSFRINQGEKIPEKKSAFQQKFSDQKPYPRPFLHPFNMNYIHQHILKLSQSQKTVNQQFVSSPNRSFSLNPSVINSQNPGLSIAQFSLQQEQTESSIRPKHSYKLRLGKRKRQSAHILSLAYTLAMVNSLGTNSEKVKIKLNRQTQKVLNYTHKLDQQVIQAKKFLSVVEQNVKGKYQYVF